MRVENGTCFLKAFFDLGPWTIVHSSSVLTKSAGDVNMDVPASLSNFSLV